MEEEMLLTKVLNDVTGQMHSNNLEGVKAEMKSLIKSALSLLEKDSSSGKLNAQAAVLAGYLNNLKRLCNGIA